MHKQTKRFTLTGRDKLVITFENGKLMLLVNNKERIDPQSLKLSTREYHDATYTDKEIKKYKTLFVDCEVEI